MTDDELAQNIYKAVDALNKALEEANKADLKVDLEMNSLATLGRRFPAVILSRPDIMRVIDWK